nr:exosortase/archaeosortase family protein [Prolixibacteraceae bacterium]
MIRKIYDKNLITSDLNRFLIKGGTLFLLWRVFRKWMILKGQYTDFTQVVSEIYLRLAQFYLTLFNFKTSVNFSERKLWITGASNAIEVVYDCLGVNLFFVFTIFLVAYPGILKHKLWYIPSGIVVVFLLNSLRMAALTPIVALYPERMD